MSSLPTAPQDPRPPARSLPQDPFVCPNCGTAYVGKFCPECGQTARSPLRHFGALIEDAFDLFLNFDGRLVRTLPALLLRPGFLTNQFFAGRRVRYTPPFRLMFVLSVLAFLTLHLAINADFGRQTRSFTTTDGFETATTPAEVQSQLADSLQGIATARVAAGGYADAGLDVAETKLRAAAAQRLAELGGKPATTPSTPVSAASVAALPTAAAATHHDAGTDTATIGVHGSLTGSVRLDHALQELDERVRSAARHPEQRQAMLASFFRTLPQAMLVLLPIFALLLKFAYLFKRRLYIEHLIVALHSHAFLFLVLLLTSGISLAVHTWPILAKPFGFVAAALWLWLPIYLLLMQKRVYRQGWTLTLLKFCFLGTAYVILVTFTVLGAAVAGALVT